MIEFLLVMISIQMISDCLPRIEVHHFPLGLYVCLCFIHESIDVANRRSSTQMGMIANLSPKVPDVHTRIGA